ncbi:MAG TPA: hypothetical protein VFG90_12490 [Nitrososphaeraceae archaeon]|nr:hypothetical protein [Nitrososphaeraceae archaeon]
MLKFLSSDVSQETASLDINSCVGICISSSGSNTDLNYSKIFNKTMNSLLIVSAIVCVMLLLFIAYAFINNSDFKLIDEISNSDTRIEIDTSSGNETANETENQ